MHSSAVCAPPCFMALSLALVLPRAESLVVNQGTSTTGLTSASSTSTPALLSTATSAPYLRDRLLPLCQHTCYVIPEFYRCCGDDRYLLASRAEVCSVAADVLTGKAAFPVACTDWLARHQRSRESEAGSIHNVDVIVSPFPDADVTPDIVAKVNRTLNQTRLQTRREIQNAVDAIVQRLRTEA
mmetsp:Transcript_23006/g.42360  ORF Transcript_23006/g.42360 Transcript_23006/m.42360 type:complete len:184 (-) Transcript_23006:18-569(-)